MPKMWVLLPACLSLFLGCPFVIAAELPLIGLSESRCTAAQSWDAISLMQVKVKYVAGHRSGHRSSGDEAKDPTPDPVASRPAAHDAGGVVISLPQRPAVSPEDSSEDLPLRGGKAAQVDSLLEDSSGPLHSTPLRKATPVKATDSLEQSVSPWAFTGMGHRTAVAMYATDSGGVAFLGMIVVVLILALFAVAAADGGMQRRQYAHGQAGGVMQRNSVGRVPRPVPPPRGLGVGPGGQPLMSRPATNTSVSSKGPASHQSPLPGSIMGPPSLPRLGSSRVTNKTAPPRLAQTLAARPSIQSAMGYQPQRPVPQIQSPPPPQGLERVSLTSIVSHKESLLPTPRSMLPTPPRLSAEDPSDGAGRPPPPLCPALVMPHCEAWFAVSMERLMEGAGSFDILGLSGAALLRATVLHSAEGSRIIEMSMTPARSPTLASIGVPGPGFSSLQVCGAGGAPYGELQPSPGPQGRYSLTIGNAEVMSIVSEAQGGRLLLYVPGSASPLGTVSRGTEGDFFHGAEHLEVCVNPGVDAVLVLCCVLAVVLFGGGQALPGR